METKHLRMDGDGTNWTIFLGDTVIGQLKHENGGLFCFIEDAYRRQHYALEACNALLDILEDEVEAISAQIKIENNAAMGLLSKLGFELRSIRGDTMTFLLEM
jgi:RimJ/RimL family protein N-acetyltransferase